MQSQDVEKTSNLLFFQFLRGTIEMLAKRRFEANWENVLKLFLDESELCFGSSLYLACPMFQSTLDILERAYHCCFRKFDILSCFNHVQKSII